MRAHIHFRTPFPRPRRPRGERGSFTFAIVFWALMVMMLAGLVVDGGLAISERQNAGDIAEQAARAAANDLDQNALRAGRYVLVKGNGPCDQAKAVAAASDAIAVVTSCDSSGTLRLAGGQVVPVVTVKIQIPYSPVLLGMFYDGTVIANAAATAHPQPGT